MQILLVVAASIFLGGCFGNAAMLEAMKDNNATICAKVVTLWGGATYLQSNPEFGTVTCDGMTVSYGNPLGVAGAVNVPLAITPNITFGAPTLK